MTVRAQPLGKREFPFAVRAGVLRGIDRIETDTMATFCFEDVRPLQGVAGFIDWRICGGLSRTMETETFRGGVGEVMLMPFTGRLAGRRLFVFGLGVAASISDETMKNAFREAAAVLSRAKVQRVVIAAPKGFGALGSALEQRFLNLVADVVAAGACPLAIESLLLEEIA